MANAEIRVGQRMETEPTDIGLKGIVETVIRTAPEPQFLRALAQAGGTAQVIREGLPWTVSVTKDDKSNPNSPLWVNIEGSDTKRSPLTLAIETDPKITKIIATGIHSGTNSITTSLPSPINYRSLLEELRDRERNKVFHSFAQTRSAIKTAENLRIPPRRVHSFLQRRTRKISV